MPLGFSIAKDITDSHPPTICPKIGKLMGMFLTTRTVLILRCSQMRRHSVNKNQPQQVLTSSHTGCDNMLHRGHWCFVGTQKEQGFAQLGTAFLPSSHRGLPLSVSFGEDLGHVIGAKGVQLLAVLPHCCEQMGMHSGDGPALSLQPSFHAPQN